MSYSSELKDYLSSLEYKKECCSSAYDDGKNLREPNYICANDRGIYLRGVFVNCGSMTDPEKQFYLSFSGEGIDIAENALIECGVFPHRAIRKGKEVVYIRDAESLGDFLTAIGAQKYTLKLMEIAVIKDTKKAINRQSNAEFANLDKAATASAEVREAIELIKKNKGFEKLPDDIKETAELRMQYPSLSLEELRLMHKKPISKSGLFHRLKRIEEYAEKYR